MLALLEQESLAAAALKRLGVTVDSLLTERHSSQVLDHARTQLDSDDTSEAQYGSPQNTPVKECDDPLEFIQILDRAFVLARREPNSTGISSVHLLMALFEINDVFRQQLIDRGVDRTTIIRELNLESNPVGPSLPIDFNLNWSINDGTSAAQYDKTPTPRSHAETAWRIIDANLNRSREGLRVLEDYARFVLSDSNLSQRLKDLRHGLVAAETFLPRNFTGVPGSTEYVVGEELLLHRDTANDVGTQLSTRAENVRNSMSDVVIANCRRIQEALRSLEEFGKLLAPGFAAAMKQIRYDSYSLQQALACTGAAPGEAVAPSSSCPRETRIQKLRDAVVYLLITESLCRHPWKNVVEASLRGGVDVFQLREKHLNDRELLRRAQWMADACRGAGRLFVMNDRADVAVAAKADGVHVGQDELDVAAARSVLSSEQLLGVSTHTLQQAQTAQNDGADYIGVGPTFPTRTKEFSDFPGLGLVTQVFGNVEIPAFAIGGISAENAAAVRRAGGSRVAVTSCVVGADNPELAVRELRKALDCDVLS